MNASLPRTGRIAETAEPAFFPVERQILVDSVVKSLLGERDVITVRGAPGVGKSTLAGVLHAQLAALGLRVVRPPAGGHEALDLQRRIGEVFGIAGADRLTPGALADAIDAAAVSPRAVVILDDAERLPAALFHYLSLMLALLNQPQRRLGLVLLGAPGPWEGLDHPYLEKLRQSARSYVVPPLSRRQAAAYLQDRLEGGVLNRRAAAALLDEAAGLPGRIDALVRRTPRRQAGRRRSWPVPVLAGAAVACVAAAAFFARPSEPPAAVAAPPPPVQSEPAPAAAVPAKPVATPPPPAPILPPLRPAPASMRSGPGLALIVQPGDTMPSLYQRVYQGMTPPPYAEVEAAIHLPLTAGAIVVFPPPPGGWPAP